MFFDTKDVNQQVSDSSEHTYSIQTIIKIYSIHLSWWIGKTGYKWLENILMETVPRKLNNA